MFHLLLLCSWSFLQTISKMFQGNTPRLLALKANDQDLAAYLQGSIQLILGLRYLQLKN